MTKQTKLSTKLIAGFVSVALITALVGAIGYRGVTKLAANLETIGGINLPGIQNLLLIGKAQTTVESAENMLLSTTLNAEERIQQHARFESAWQQASKARTLYEALPLSRKEAEQWRGFTGLLDAWWQDHLTFARLEREFAQIGILNPPALERDLQQIMKDHTTLNLAIIKHIQQDVPLSYGDDHTSCNYAKWLLTFQTSNSELQRLIESIQAYHAAFHTAVKHAKELTAKGDRDGAIKVVHIDMEAAAKKTFEGFDLMFQEANKASAMLEKMNEQALTKNAESYALSEGVLNQMVSDTMASADAAKNTGTHDAVASKIFANIGVAAGFILTLAFGMALSASISRALSRIIEKLSSGATQVNTASSRVAASSQQLSEGSSEQAASLEETSAALEEVSSMTRQNADNAAQANKLMVETKTSVGGGVEAMARMTKAIGQINSSSNEMANIIKNIDEIAFQTNLLALNAAVEAARAGEAGKGFAVVAEEVRNLAGRSAEAARSTTSLIEESQTNSEAGVAVSKEVSTALAVIQKNADQIATLVADIASASREQAQGVDQVNIAVSEMDKVVQQNAVNAENSADASEELAGQARELNTMVAELAAIINGTSNQESNQPGLQQGGALACYRIE